jgi:hypothetical protein
MSALGDTASELPPSLSGQQGDIRHRPGHNGQPGSRSTSAVFRRGPDGIEIFYKDWGSGQPIVFSHGWPLAS